ncbi:MAG: hypothetical protein F4Y30_03665, partial [Chloroflexi bacterium]|nr:hypothetical protein [Chloroflexota bacterium]MYE77557.1 hypothetical protein [Chloroflexota bacterium]
MSRFQTGALIDKLLFSAMLAGILLAGFGGLRYLDLSNQLADNPAAQIHERDEAVQVENTDAGYSLMTADITRRRQLEEQYNMMIIGGLGLALLGLGWLGSDIVRSRRKPPSPDP